MQRKTIPARSQPNRIELCQSGWISGLTKIPWTDCRQLGQVGALPGHGIHLLHEESVTHVISICVTYVFEWFTIDLPSWPRGDLYDQSMLRIALATFSGNPSSTDMNCQRASNMGRLWNGSIDALARFVAIVASRVSSVKYAWTAAARTGCNSPRTRRSKSVTSARRTA